MPDLGDVSTGFISTLNDSRHADYAARKPHPQVDTEVSDFALGGA